MKVLRARLYEAERQRKEDAAGGAPRQVGTGDRSDKIRTYNFPQGRVTDHRIGLTHLSVGSDILDGNVDALIDPLMQHDQEEKLLQQQHGMVP